MKITRAWAMPNAETFSIKPIRDLLHFYLSGVGIVVDPFARNSDWGDITNDLNPETAATHHMLAEDFVKKIKNKKADAVLFDPPYSPRQISEVYQQVGRKCTGKDTQNARLYKVVRDGLAHILKPHGLAVSFGWNSAGFGKSRGFEVLEILLVAHGGAHNDTIVVVERKL